MKSGMEHKKVGGQKLRIVPAEQAISDGSMNEFVQKAAAVGRNLREELGGDLMKPQIATRCILLTNLVTKEEVSSYTKILNNSGNLLTRILNNGEFLLFLKFSITCIS